MTCSAHAIWRVLFECVRRDYLLSIYPLPHPPLPRLAGGEFVAEGIALISQAFSPDTPSLSTILQTPLSFLQFRLQRGDLGRHLFPFVPSPQVIAFFGFVNALLSEQLYLGFQGRNCRFGQGHGLVGAAGAVGVRMYPTLAVMFIPAFLTMAHHASFARSNIARR